MVTFICPCQESMTRGKVDAHVARCAHARSLSCVDCHAVFTPHSYRAHVACISEEEKYTGRKPKRDAWLDSVPDALELLAATGEHDARKVLDAIVAKVGHAIPKKRKQFVNFCASSFGAGVKPAVVDRVWGAMESAKKARVAAEDAQKAEAKAKANKARALALAAEGTDASAGLVKTRAAEDESGEVKARKRKLKTYLKANAKAGDESGAELRTVLAELSDCFETKRDVKSLVRAFPGKFALVKDATGSKRVKLV